jgi:putative DNA primase/helicase
MTTLDQAIAQMRANGMPEFPPGHPKVGIGRITRYGPKKNGWYRLEVLRTRGNREVIVGAFGYWGKLEPQKIEVDWKGDLGRGARRARGEGAGERAHRAREARGSREARANRAQEQWRARSRRPAPKWLIDHGEPERPPSEYLQRKGVQPEACRFFTDGTLLVPMLHYNATDGARLAGLQKISPDGTKRFNKGMAMEGAACRLGEPPSDGDLILITEGFATGLSLREATVRSVPVFLAFNAGNLKPVAERLRARYPLSPLIFCADDDWKTKRHDGTPWNPGVEYAQATPRARQAIPGSSGRSSTNRSREEKWTDFNDLHLA